LEVIERLESFLQLFAGQVSISVERSQKTFGVLVVLAIVAIDTSRNDISVAVAA
jgi:hypothetical protein